MIAPTSCCGKIRLGEDSSLELTSVIFRGNRVAAPGRDELADEIGAISNTADGVLVLGVDDKSREVIGIPLDKLDVTERTVFEVCNDSIRPPVAFRSLRMELPDSTGTPRAVLKISSQPVHSSEPRRLLQAPGQLETGDAA